MNSVLAGAMTGAVLASRGGLQMAIRSGLIGGAILFLIEISIKVRSKMELRMYHQREAIERDRMAKIVEQRRAQMYGASGLKESEL